MALPARRRWDVWGDNAAVLGAPDRSPNDISGADIENYMVSRGYTEKAPDEGPKYRFTKERSVQLGVDQAVQERGLPVAPAELTPNQWAMLVSEGLKYARVRYMTELPPGGARRTG